MKCLCLFAKYSPQNIDVLTCIVTNSVHRYHSFLKMMKSPRYPYNPVLVLIYFHYKNLSRWPSNSYSVCMCNSILFLFLQPHEIHKWDVRDFCVVHVLALSCLEHSVLVLIHESSYINGNRDIPLARHLSFLSAIPVR